MEEYAKKNDLQQNPTNRTKLRSHNSNARWINTEQKDVMLEIIRDFWLNFCNSSQGNLTSQSSMCVYETYVLTL